MHLFLTYYVLIIKDICFYDTILFCSKEIAQTMKSR